jgi:hypothetical protein
MTRHGLNPRPSGQGARQNKLDQQQTAKADEIRELKREIREAVQQNG